MSERSRSSKSSNICKAHETFDEVERVYAVKRKLSFEKGEEIQGPRHQVASAEVKFQRFDEQDKDYVEISNEEKLKEDIKVEALIVPKKQYELNGIKPNTSYRLWNLVSKQNDAILKRDSSNNKVFCDGVLETPADPNTVVEFGDASKDHYNMNFNKKYCVIGNGEGNEITAVNITKVSGDSEFEIIDHGIFRMIKQKGTANLYLGCNADGKTTLVAIKNRYYPTPQALFIIYEI